MAFFIRLTAQGLQTSQMRIIQTQVRQEQFMLLSDMICYPGKIHLGHMLKHNHLCLLHLKIPCRVLCPDEK